MLLTIHNLPNNVHRSDIKLLIESRCNVVNFFLNNLMYESSRSRKVTIQLSDESDAALITYKLSGYVYKGQSLLVTHVNENKAYSHQMYNSRDEHQNNTANVIHVVKHISPVRKNEFASSISVPTNHPCSFPNKLSDNQNACMPFSGLNKTTRQPMMVPHPNETQHDFISFTNNASLNDLGINENLNRTRYFNKDFNEQHPSDTIPSFRESSRGVRGDRTSPPRHHEGINDRLNSPSGFDKSRYDGGNRSDQLSRHPYGVKNRTGKGKSSNRYQLRSMNSNKQTYNKNRQIQDDNYDCEEEVDYEDYNEESSLELDEEYNHTNLIQTDNNYRQLQKQTRNNYNRNDVCRNFNNFRFDAEIQRSDEYNRSEFEGPTSDNFQRNHHQESNMQEEHNFENLLKQRGNYERKKAPENVNLNQVKNNYSRAISVKDEMRRNHAASIIVEQLFAIHDMEHLKRIYQFVPYLTSVVRSRVDNIMAGCVSKSLDQILEMYNFIYPVDSQKLFLVNTMSKYSIISFNKEPKPQEGETSTKADGPMKRTFTGQNEPQPWKKKKFNNQEVQPEQASHPTTVQNSKKKKLQKLKKPNREEFEGEVEHKLEPKLQQALEEELKTMGDLLIRECQKNEGMEENQICQHIEKLSEKLKKTIMIRVTEGILNKSNDLLVKVYSRPRIEPDELASLTDLGLVKVTKPLRGKFLLAACDSYSSYDRLCCADNINIRGYSLVFKPLYIPKCKLKGTKINNEISGDGHQDSGDDDLDEEENKEYSYENDQNEIKKDHSDSEHNDHKKNDTETGGDETTIKDTSDDIEDKKVAMKTEIKENISTYESNEICDEKVTADKTIIDEEITRKDKDIEIKQEETNTASDN